MNNLKWKFILFEVLTLSPHPAILGVVIDNSIAPTAIPAVLVVTSLLLFIVGASNFMSEEVK